MHHPPSPSVATSATRAPAINALLWRAKVQSKLGGAWCLAGKCDSSTTVTLALGAAVHMQIQAFFPSHLPGATSCKCTSICALPVERCVNWPCRKKETKTWKEPPSLPTVTRRDGDGSRLSQGELLFLFQAEATNHSEATLTCMKPVCYTQDTEMKSP